MPLDVVFGRLCIQGCQSFCLSKVRPAEWQHETVFPHADDGLNLPLEGLAYSHTNTEAAAEAHRGKKRNN